MVNRQDASVLALSPKYRKSLDSGIKTHDRDVDNVQSEGPQEDVKHLNVLAADALAGPLCGEKSIERRKVEALSNSPGSDDRAVSGRYDV
jgi:hypothetical protein